MPQFSDTVAALLAGKKINIAVLLTIAFPDDTVFRLWTGDGNITVGAEVYQGSGRLVSLENLDAAIGTDVPNATIKFSGVDATLSTLAVSEREQAFGADIEVAVQMFGDGEIAGEWHPVDNPVGIGSWVGDQLSFDRQGPAVRTISLTMVSFFASRSRGQNAFYSARDQQLRFPGDRGGEFIASLVAKNINWPNGLFV